MTAAQMSFVPNVCARCGQEAPRYRARGTACKACVVKDAMERNRAKGKDYWTAVARRHRQALDPDELRARRRAERARQAEKAGREYNQAGPRRSDDERRLDWETRQKAGRVRVARGRRSRGGETAGMTPAERHRHYYATRPDYVINGRMRTSIKKALRGGKAGRAWEALVGYTLADLMAHLERQMPKGFTLDDFGAGRIHIDHIIPKSTFDVTNPAELRACWALSNLRPVTAKVNLKKGAKRDRLL